MNDEEYKALILFELLYYDEDEDLNLYNYAAVDADNTLWVYEDKPSICGDDVWWDAKLAGISLKYMSTPPPNWKNTLVEI